MIVFDIETDSLPLEEIQSVLPPFDPSSIGPPPGEFDPDSVKTGNTKDQAKIDAKIEAAREKHVADIAGYERKQATAETNHWNDVVSKAALSAVTGRVCAIGYAGKNEQLHLAIGDVSERQLLLKFWQVYKTCRTSNRPLVGFNIKPFDVPFIAQRSWALGIEVPSTLLTPTGYLDQTFIDLRERWQCGVRWGGQSGHGTLDAVCRSCGLPAKRSDICGADFAKLLYGDDSERESAIDYLKHDLAATTALAERLGVS
ncbi:ribonuclease H-like domain-containing protein [Roseiconus lacunae]|uniref:ribonuclease H-like domain-containing protein n=1 Tax=Roseiconus lacunae TaxID=2605694 RepID=UPI001E588DFC|nr:ribonuclease H-like domain-containing protein [Roseiconus lacunae]MCD0459144.1 hypothetical protein [Roseiconus lacunae]